jgi:hypothetical protein
MKNFQRHRRHPKGAIALLTIVTISAFTLAIVTAVSVIATSLVSNATTHRITEQVFFAAESGLQDALYRIGIGNITTIPTYSIGNVDVTVTITPNGFHPIVTSVAQDGAQDIKRSLRIVVNSPTFTGFNYAISTGTGGIGLDTESVVNGDIYSNGPIDRPGGGHATINGNVWLADGNIISGINYGVSGDVHAQSPESIDSSTPVYGNKIYDNPPLLPYPVQQPEIDSWISQASADTSNPNYNKNISGSASLGLVKVKSITLGTHDVLTATGIIYVDGNTKIGNATIKASLPAGTNATVIISKGTITMDTGATIDSSGGYIMLISNYQSANNSDVAISPGVLTNGVIYYAKDGVIEVANNGILNGTIGKYIHLKKAEVNYNSTLPQLFFSTGSSSPFSVNSASWEEF